MKWTLPLLAALLLAGCGDAPTPLTLTDQPPASTFQTPPPPPAERAPVAAPTAEIRGTVTP